jgi:hypothetical protein
MKSNICHDFLLWIQMTINPEMKAAEISFDNNSAVCTLVYDLSAVHVFNCTLAPIWSLVQS